MNRVVHSGDYGDETFVGVASENLPETIVDNPQFLIAKRSPDENENKRPLYPRDPTEVGKGLSLDHARRLARELPTFSCSVRQRKGEETILGFMLSSEDPLVLVDWDNVRDRNVGNETVPEFVRDKIKEIGGYVSVSISGTGLHQLCSADEQTQELIEDNKSRADLPLDPVGRLKERPHVEIYQSKRYFTLTGDRFIDPIRGETFENLSSSNDALRSFVDQYLQSGYSTTKTNRSVGEAESSKNQSLVDLSNRAATKHAHRYSNMTWRDTDSPTVEEIKWTGFYYEGEFRKLWEGNENESDYPSRSEADEAFFSRLWFYCDDRGLLWDCLPACKRYRPKWERTDYLRRSIEKVRDNDRYNGEYRSPREKVQG